MSVVRRRRPRSHRRRDGLIRYARNVVSQSGEDGILQFLFSPECIGGDASRDDDGNRWCVEVGSWDGRHLSNTWNLLNNSDDNEGGGRWRGVLIEANPERSAEAESRYNCRRDDVVCLCATVGLDGGDSLDSILAQRVPNLSDRFAMLSVDVDSFDYWVWEGLHNYSPDVLVIEFNPTIPNHVVFIQERSTKVAQGSSAAALVELAEVKGYRLCETTLYNAIFVREDLWALVNPHCPDDTSLDALHELSMGTDIWQLYDGTVHLGGCKKLLWHRRGMPTGVLRKALAASAEDDDHEEEPPERRRSSLAIDVLPPKERGIFPFAPPPKQQTQPGDGDDSK